MAIDVIKIDPASPPQRSGWQAFVERHPQATLHHELAWIDAVLATFPHVPHLLLARRGREVAGVFPVFEVHSMLAGTLLVSMPYGIYGGVLADDDEVADALLQAVRGVARDARARCIDIRSRQACFPGLQRVERYVTFVKDLPDDPQGVWPSVPRKARAEARRARERFGMQARFDQSQLDVVWSLYSRSMRRLGSPNMPRRFFEALTRGLGARHLVSVIHDGQQPRAGLLSFIHRDTVMPYYSGCDDRAHGMGVNNYLYVSLMEEAVARGLRRFDFGRSRVDNPGAYGFKKNQGFTPRPLGYQMDGPPGRALPNLTPGNPRFRLAQWTWKRLPLAFTRPLGAWLSASIPG